MSHARQGLYANDGAVNRVFLSRARQQAVVLILAAASLAAQTYTPESLGAELSRIDQEIQSSVTPQLPDHWHIHAGTRDYDIPTAPLRSFFRGVNGSSPDEARAWIANMRRDLEAFNTPRASTTAARSELNAILARKEFQPPPPPNALQQFWDRVQNYIGNLIQSILQIAAQHPAEARFVFWAVIVAIIMGLIWWLSKFIRQPSNDPQVSTPPKELVLKSWQEWLTAARTAASQRDFRKAIHDAYWAAIARLQLERTIHINLTDTPRERLHSVTKATRKYQPLPAPELESLTAVTNAFERVWYADLPATAEDVDRAFNHLEILGCKAG